MNDDTAPRGPHRSAGPSLLMSPRTVARVASALAVLVGGLVLVGWQFNLEPLKRILPGFVAMNPTTALAFIVAGVSLGLLVVERPGHRRRLAQGLAGVVALVGLLKLAGVLVGWDLGLDQVLFREKLGAVGAHLPNRMAPNTALGFLVIGCALVLLDRPTRRGRWPSPFLGLVAVMASLLPVLGYLYGSHALYGIGAAIPMAFHTALTFLVLSVGILCARPDRGLMALVTSAGPGGVMARRWLPAVVVVSAGLGWVQLAEQRAGLYDTEFGAALLVVATMTIFTLLVGWHGHALARADIERQRAEAEHHRYFTLSPDMLCIVGFDGYFKQLNPAWERTMGFAEQDLLARPYLDLVHPDDRAATIAQARQLVAGGRAISFENRYRCRDGAYRWFAWNATPDGEHGVIYAAARDITERKRAEAALRQQTAFVRLLQVAAVAANEAPTVDDALQTVLDQVGAHADWPVGHVYLPDDDSPGGLAPTALWHLAEPEHFAAFRRLTEATRPAARGGLLGRVLASGQPVWVTDVAGEPDRTRAELAAALGLRAGLAFPVLVGAEVVAVLEFFSAEAFEPDPQLVDVMAHIGTQLGRVVERERAEWALRATKAEAEQANGAKSEFLSRMSHELRTPLNAILGFGQLLAMDELTPDERESVAQILKGGRHLLALINEVLDIARIETGRLSLSLEPVPLAEVMTESLDLIQPLAAQHHIQLSSDAAGGCDRHVLADRQRLKQVLLNLLSNAVKYNREQGRVACACTVTAEGRLRLTVSDTGPGIPPERLVRLFTPFDRLGAERTDVEGTGLGLALSKRLVEAMGGTLGVTSQPGEGSTFWVDLPVAEGPLTRHERLGTGPLAATPERPAHAGTVLYVEDNLSNLRLVERLVAKQRGVRLLTAMQGRLGLALAQEHRPDLVLLDLHLPDMAGDQVLRQLQAAAATRAIPVVMLSADATAGQSERLLAAGARAYLTKPLDVREFLDIVDATLRDGRVRA